MKAALKLPVSVEDYLEGEKTSPVKHEYVNGQVYAMTGTTVGHGQTTLGLALALRRRAGARGCQVLVNDLKVHVSASNACYYPDVVLTRERPSPDSYVIAQPCLIAEVLSPSTEATDRREKLQAYRTLDCLQEYLIVSPGEPKIEVWRRTPQGWVQELLEAEDSLRVDCLDTAIPLAEIYAA